MRRISARSSAVRQPHRARAIRARRETYTVRGERWRQRTARRPARFNKVLWQRGEELTRGDTAGVTFRYTSRDGEEGYPGTLHVAVSYGLTPNDELVIDYEATTDKATPVNFSQHSYWNLHGGGRGTILDHLLTIDAAGYTPVDSTLIPTGAITPVAGTPFDFRAPTAIGARIGQTDTAAALRQRLRPQLGPRPKGATGLAHAVRVADTTTGRTLDITTTEPGLQFYSGNFLDGSIHGKGGEPTCIAVRSCSRRSTTRTRRIRKRFRRRF